MAARLRLAWLVGMLAACAAVTAMPLPDAGAPPTDAASAMPTRAEMAAAAAQAAGLSPTVSAALAQAAEISVMNEDDAATAINSTARSLMKWAWEELPARASSPTGNLATTPCCAQLASIPAYGASLLPRVIINTGGAVVPLRQKVPATICACPAPGSNTGGGHQGFAEVRVRGSSSAVQMVKKSLSITMRQGGGNGEPAGSTLTEADLGRKEDVAFLGKVPMVAHCHASNALPAIT
jgi:hypothetical protein